MYKTNEVCINSFEDLVSANFPLFTENGNI